MPVLNHSAPSSTEGPATSATSGHPRQDPLPSPNSRSADHLSSLFCSTAALDRTFCWAEVIGGAATVVVVVDELLLAGTLVLRPTTSAMLPRCQ